MVQRKEHKPGLGAHPASIIPFTPRNKPITFPPVENRGGRMGVLKFQDSKTKDSYPKGVSERPFQ